MFRDAECNVFDIFDVLKGKSETRFAGAKEWMERARVVRRQEARVMFR